MLNLVKEAAIAATIALSLDFNLFGTIVARGAQLFYPPPGGDYNANDIANSILVAPADGLPAIESGLGVSHYRKATRGRRMGGMSHAFVAGGFTWKGSDQPQDVLLAEEARSQPPFDTADRARGKVGASAGSGK